jgi:hypothetical protein
MKNQFLKLSVLLIVVAMGICSCKKENAVVYTDEGLPTEVTNNVPDSLLQILIDLGMPINEGNHPPTISGIYLMSPQTLKASNISTDVIGHTYVDLKVKFENQDINKNQIYSQKKDVVVTKNNLSYMSGFDDKFTVYSISESYIINSFGDTTDIQEFLYVFSGIKSDTSNGIQSFHHGILSLRPVKNTTNYFLVKGKARIIYDSNGFSETQTTFRVTNDFWNPTPTIIDPLTVNP